MKHIWIFICIIASTVLSCTNTFSPVNVLVSRIDNFGTTVAAEQALLFHIKSFSTEENIKNIVISSYDPENGTILLLDSSINATTADFDFAYRTLAYSLKDTTNVKITFTAYTSDGESSKMVFLINVIGDILLRSYDGIVMYAANSYKPNGFNLAFMQTLYCETADSSKIDIYDYFSTTDSMALSREWRSNTNLLFTKYNDFDYANASLHTLIDAYLAGSRYTSIKELQNGDIIIVGRGNKPLGVIQIVAVYDEENSVNDRYLFNIKK